VPLAVWPCAQNRGEPEAAETSHRAIMHYSEPGGLVLDPLCDDPTAATLIEAIRLGRDALGLTSLDPAGNADQALALHEAQRSGANGNAQLLVGEPCELARLLARKAAPLLNRRTNGAGLREIARHPCSAVDLVLLSATLLPPEQQPRRHHWLTHTASGHQLLSACTALLRPGGFLLFAAPTAHPDAEDTDPVSELVRIGQSHGLQYWQHVIVLHAPIENGQLHPIATTSRNRCHGDLLAFRKPQATHEQHEHGNSDARWAA
jgi:hypothetical protein